MSPAETTWTMVNPAACATVAVFSAPLVTVHVVPETLVTAMISPVFPFAVSATWNWVGGVAVFDAAGNDADDATVQLSLVPDAGAVVPPEETVVDGWFAYVTAVVATRLPGQDRYGVPVTHRKYGMPIVKTAAGPVADAGPTGMPGSIWPGTMKPGIAAPGTPKVT